MTLSIAYVATIEPKPMSLPPIVSVTRSVSVVSALNCGGLLPRGTDWDWVMSTVVAPPQEMSTNVCGLIVAARSDG